jgi:predicted acyltransferase
VATQIIATQEKAIAAELTPGDRLLSLDVFRGATIAAMMLVNNPGDWANTYAPLLHAEWHGWTFTDLVFPFFLWIVGVAIPLSCARRLAQGQSRRELLLHAVRRSAILFGLGLFLNSFSYLIDGSILREGVGPWLRDYLTTVRVPGVLQRIAVCYLASTAVFLFGGIRLQGGMIAGLLAAYWLVMMAVPVPGFGPGVLEKEGNLAQYIDNLVLNGPVVGTHVWKSARTWDPEGILSTFPAIATCLFGVLAGQLLRGKLRPEIKTTWLFFSGNVLMLCGVLMNPWFPINKGLWTSSYVLFMAGIAAACFAALYWLVDVHGWRKWCKPFAIYGMNAITVFVLAGVIGRVLLEIKISTGAGEAIALKTFLYQKLFLPFASPDTAPWFGLLASPKNASLLWALMCVLVLYGIAWAMYKRRWFVKF